MSFAAPTYLITLLGLLVPLAIHLWSKKEGRVIKVGSTQFLPEVESKQSSSLRINEIILLVLRMILMGLLSFILAQLFFKSTANNESKLVFIDPLIADRPEANALLDSLANQEYEIKAFLPGFPNYDQEKHTQSAERHWQLVEELNRVNAQDIVLITSSVQKSFKGARPTSHRPLSWITLENQGTNMFLASAVQGRDSVYLVKGNSNREHTAFERDQILKGEIESDSDSTSFDGLKGTVRLIKDTITVRIHSGPGFERDAMYLKTAVESISEFSRYPLKISDNKQADWLFWLSDEEIDGNQSNQIVRYKRDTLSCRLIIPTSDPRVYHITGRLNVVNVVKGSFVTQLFKVMRKEIEAGDQIEKFDQRQLAEAQLQPNYEVRSLNSTVKKPMNDWLWLLFLAVFATERIVSYVRKQ
ncbi:hypothetical protein E1176_18650 [Fulvivirga sp. RKSG066]|uniref:BatA domain-containing protein n=1 Tax=Fulvivirga aurantia TaxID=2529383 RepID=UPI0012BCCD74|nr:BatA domain-containing protein [Fulvivirga aurantia]MTI23057.1 hypothetical protein [Fulvivirga aurantia]